MMDKTIGKKMWCFAAGHIPLISTGIEPDFTSNDKIAVLNVTESKAEIEMQIFYEDRAPVLYKKIVVQPLRIRKVRINDLINPIPVPLDTPYGLVIRSSVPVIIQFSRMNTGSRNVAGICTNAFAQPDE